MTNRYFDTARCAQRAVAPVFFTACLTLTPGLLAQVAGLDRSAITLSQEERESEISLSIDKSVTMAGHTFDTATARPVTLLSDQIVHRTAQRRMIIQIDGPMTPARQAAIDAAGLTVLEYLPTYAYIVETTAARPERVAQLGFIRWHAGIEPQHKVSQELGNRRMITPERLALDEQGRHALLVTVFAGADALDAAKAILQAAPSAIVNWADQNNDLGEISVEVDVEDVLTIAGLEDVQFVEELPEVTLRNKRSSWIVQSNINGAESIHARGIRGEGQIVGIMDGRVNPNHCSFADSQTFGNNHRKIQAYNTTTGSDYHGTHVAGTVVGDDGTTTDKRGIAYKGKFTFNTYTFTESSIYSRLLQHHNQGARVHTNSWGNDGTTSYDGLCRGFDAFQYNYEDSLVLLAVTNSSSLKNPENAKNLLAVGASQSSGNQQTFCSGGSGPTADGRRKPEIYAPGCGTISSSSSCSASSLTGTSMACPAVAASAMLVRQYFVDGFYPTGAANPSDSIVPSGALMKAVLLNSTVDMTGVSGYPSNREGWGRVLLDDALAFAGESTNLIVEDIRNANGLSTGQIYELPFEVTSSADRLKITLVWTDPPASASTGSGNAWVNNLDLLVISPSGEQYRGNVFSNGVSVTEGTHDIRNNVEMVLSNSPEVGGWTARVRAAGVNVGGTQGFALVISGRIGNDQAATPPGAFGFLSPAANIDDIDPAQPLLLQWQNSSGAAKYFVTVSDGFGPVFGPTSTTNTSVSIPANTFDFSTTYTWSVVAENSDGAKTQSVPASRSFTTIDLTPLCIGDINGNNTTDMGDFNILAVNYGQSGVTRSQGDLNGDGRVDLGDFTLFAVDFGCSK